MKPKTLALSIVLLAGLAACDSGTWVDVGGIVGGCTGGKPSGLGMKGPADVKLFGQGMAQLARRTTPGTSSARARTCRSSASSRAPRRSQWVQHGSSESPDV